MTQLHILADYFGNIIACNHFLYVFLWVNGAPGLLSRIYRNNL